MNYSYTMSMSDLSKVMGPLFIPYLVFCFALCVLGIVSMWKIFVKSGRSGWKCLIPFYNMYCEFDMLYGNGWKFLLLLIPFYNIYVAIKFVFDLAKAFGKGTGFGFGLLFLSFIFQCILAFGPAEYVGDYPGDDIAVKSSSGHKQTITRANSFEK